MTWHLIFVLLFVRRQYKYQSPFIYHNEVDSDVYLSQDSALVPKLVELIYLADILTLTLRRVRIEGQSGFFWPSFGSAAAVLCSTIQSASWLGSRGRGPRPSGFFFGGFFFLSAMRALYRVARQGQQCRTRTTNRPAASFYGIGPSTNVTCDLNLSIASGGPMKPIL